MSAGIILQQMLIIFILIFTGFILKRKEMIGAQMSKGISTIVVNVCNPALILTGVLQRDSSVSMDKVLLAAAGGALLYGILILAGILLPKVLKIPPLEQRFYNMLTVFGNIGFIGIPLISAVVGPQALIYVVIANIYFTLIVYTYGIRLVEGGGKKEKFQWKKLCNTGNLASVLCIVIFAGNLTLPKVITDALSYMGNATTAMAMIVIGISLAQISARELLQEKKMYPFIFLRFFVLPIAASFLFRLFMKDEMLYGTFVILLAVPAANMPLMLAEERGLDGRVLSKGIILSTLCSLLTIPAVAVFT